MKPELGNLDAQAPIDGQASSQWVRVTQLIAAGFEVAADDGWHRGGAESTHLGGHVVLTRGTVYRLSGWDYILTLVTWGLWVLVIGVKAATSHRRVVIVAPDGTVHQLSGLEAPAWAVALGVIALGALGLLIATIFSPTVAAIAVPVGVALLGRIGD